MGNQSSQSTIQDQEIPDYQQNAISGTEKRTDLAYNSSLYGNVNIYRNVKRGILIAQQVHTCTSEEEIKQFEDQIRIQKQLEKNSVYILQIVNSKVLQSNDMCSNMKRYQLNWEFLETTIYDVILEHYQKQIRFTEIAILQVLYQILQAMKSFQETGITHGSIQPKNILLSLESNQQQTDINNVEQKIKFKLSFIEFMSQQNHFKNLVLGIEQQCYLAPEIYQLLTDKNFDLASLNSENFSLDKAEIYSLAIIALNMALLEDLQDIYDRIECNIDFKLLYQKLNEVSQFYSPQFCNLIYTMLNPDPAMRPSIQELIMTIQPIIQLYENESLQLLIPKQRHAFSNTQDMESTYKMQQSHQQQQGRLSSHIVLQNNSDQKQQQTNSSPPNKSDQKGISINLRTNSSMDKQYQAAKNGFHMQNDTSANETTKNEEQMNMYLLQQQQQQQQQQQLLQQQKIEYEIRSVPEPIFGQFNVNSTLFEVDQHIQTVLDRSYRVQQDYQKSIKHNLVDEIKNDDEFYSKEWTLYKQSPSYLKKHKEKSCTYSPANNQRSLANSNTFYEMQQQQLMSSSAKKLQSQNNNENNNINSGSLKQQPIQNSAGSAKKSHMNPASTPPQKKQFPNYYFSKGASQDFHAESDHKQHSNGSQQKPHQQQQNKSLNINQMQPEQVVQMKQQPSPQESAKKSTQKKPTKSKVSTAKFNNNGNSGSQQTFAMPGNGKVLKRNMNLKNNNNNANKQNNQSQSGISQSSARSPKEKEVFIQNENTVSLLALRYKSSGRVTKLPKRGGVKK